MDIKHSTALVTGANRGIGKQFIYALMDAGIKKIYASARDVDSLAPLVETVNNKIETLKLDITNAEDVQNAAEKCTDINLLINNAGINFNTPLIGIGHMENARMEMETNYFGTLRMCRDFAEILKSNGGGAIVNMLSILSRVSIPSMGSLCASKAAGLIMTQGVRAELANQKTLVVAVMPGAVDTRMAKDFEGPKASPKEVATTVINALINEEEEVYPGDMASEVDAGLASDPKAVEKEFAEYLPK